MAQNIEGGSPKNKSKAKVSTTVYGIVVVLVLLLPFVTYPDPPPGAEGIILNLGQPDVGQGDENAPKSEPETKPQEETKPETKPEEPVTKPKKETKKPKVKKPEPAKKNVITNDDSKERAIKAEKKRKAAEVARQVQEAKDAAQAEENRRKAAKKAEDDAKKAKEDAYNKKKSGIGNLFNGGGKGKTDKPGNQGDKQGDPNSDILTGITSGAGRVGGGLAGRGGNGPKITDTSQKTGTVVVKVKVNDSGKVIYAKYTRKGSNTQDQTLIKLAEANAKRWSFKKGTVDEQTGTITYVFKVK